MKRTLVVLALGVLSCAGCRAMGPDGGYGSGASYGGPRHAGRGGYLFGAMGGGSECAAPCAPGCAAPCGPGCGTPGGRQGCLDACCQNSGCGCGMFNRYCGHNCGPGHHPGPYDCSPCDSPHWGCTGYRHPHGYVSGQECRICDSGGHPCPSPGGVCNADPLAPGYWGGGPAGPGCANSGDHIYNFNPGPPVAQTAYPYYTLRGPRDFLMANPPSIGPY